ncbi:hypothetical protein B0H13DRAFT_2316130 [Mycena leptocephala]|nr:hypothetical protein B0H13DRAFT_2316130 [Mycena leptocephala]
MARDQQKCRLTGAADDISLSRIIPAYQNQTKSSWYDSFNKDFVAAENVLTMRTGLKFHFHSSNFSVNVDDRHRIVVLRDMGPALSFLLTHLPRHSTRNAKVDTFLLRDHFKYSLGGMVLGGDIGDL